MGTVLFNRETLVWSGTDRKPFLSEIPVYDIDVTEFSKTVKGQRSIVRKDEQDNTLYALITKGEKVEEEVELQEHVTEVTDTPLLVGQSYLSPLVDSKGKKVTYTKKVTVKSTTESDRPCLVKVKAHGGFIWVPEKDNSGLPLYYNEVEEDKVIDCSIGKNREVQARDEFGELLYVKRTKIKNVYYAEPTVEFIDKFDPRWTQNLYPATQQEDVMLPVKFKDNPEIFTYEDAMNYKIENELENSFSSRAVPLLTPVIAYKANVVPLDGDKLLGDSSFIIYTGKLNLENHEVKYISCSVSTDIPVRMSLHLQLSNGVEIPASKQNVFTLTPNDAAYLTDLDNEVRVKVVNKDNMEVQVSVPVLLY